MSNAFQYQEDWEAKLQERLSEPTKWKDICYVDYTDIKVLHNPYMADPSVTTGTRGTAYSFTDVTQTDENVSIDTYKMIPQYIDMADLAQSQYVNQMILAERQGIILNEAIEAAVYADYGNMTAFGSGTSDPSGLGLSSTNITVSANNIDDIIRGIKREIRKAAGQALFNRNGGFIVWRPADLELLETFMQANGFVSADQALDGNGAALNALNGDTGINYMGMTHYSSNQLTAGHVIAGVKKMYHLGILKSTYGRVYIVDHPAGSSGGVLSGIGVETRVDYKGKVWHNAKPILFNVNVA